MMLDPRVTRGYLYLAFSTGPLWLASALQRWRASGAFYVLQTHNRVCGDLAVDVAPASAPFALTRAFGPSVSTTASTSKTISFPLLGASRCRVVPFRKVSKRLRGWC